MGFEEQLTTLLILILVLGLAYAGVNYWSRKGADLKGGLLGKLVGGGGAASSDELAPGAGLDGDMGDEGPRPSMSATGERVRQLNKRYELSGKDAEMAAKVLKRMLKQDEK